MAHMVIFRTTDGKPAYHQTEALDDAVRFVEHLRNEEQVTDARIFTMNEVPIEFKVQWRVEVAAPVMPSALERPVEPMTPVSAVGSAELDRAEAVDSDSVESSESDDSDETDEEPVPVAVGGGESLDGEAHEDSDLPAAPSSSSASSRFGLFSRG